MSISNACNNLFKAIDNDSTWTPKLVISSSHFMTTNGNVVVRSVEKPKTNSTLQCDVDVFVVLPQASVLIKENPYLFSKVLNYPDAAAIEMEGFKGVNDWNRLKQHIVVAANQGGTSLTTYDSHLSYSKQ